MPSAVDILRARQRRRSRQRPLRLLERAGRLLATILALVIGVVGLAGAIAVADVRQDLPSVEAIEALFVSGPGGTYLATQFYDRTGQVLLSEAANPSGVGRRGLPLDPATPRHLPESLVQAIVAYEDPGFWRQPGYDLGWLVSAVAEGLRGQAPTTGGSIAQRLATSTLIPPGEQQRPALVRTLRTALVASELIQVYSREQVLEWYLNSADFGHQAYGADAAALVYFGKHADLLSLAESALLAGVLPEPSLNPLDSPQQAKARQAQVLDAMVRQGVITASEAEAALAEPLHFRSPESLVSQPTSEFATYAEQRLTEILGPAFAGRGGLRVITTLDYDLQLQAECVVQTQMARLSGGEPGAVIPAADGSACVAASLLSPLRPSDAGLDHGLSAAAIVVIDPTTGEVLSLVGLEDPEAAAGGGTVLATDLSRPAGPALYPFIYLTAFANGYTPATMVLDIPTVIGDPEGGPAFTPQNNDGQFHGPIRMRTALANAYTVSAARALGLMGVENVLRTAHQMGVSSLDSSEIRVSVQATLERGEASLLDLTYAYGVIAADGQMAGVATASEAQRQGFRDVDPVVILRVEDGAGRVIYQSASEARAVVSPQLAYLMTNVLSDEAARWPTFGHPNPLEIGRPAGAVAGTAGEGGDSWAIGITPSRAVGVWLGNPEGEPMVGIGTSNGAAPIWNALVRYASRDLPAEGWSQPPGVSEVEVCDPSGLLPTAYCPNTAREVFVVGTEPTHYDTLYQPFRINRETGKLATLFTPLDLVEERVYLIPPPEAAEWARAAGIEQPPQEYDTIYQQAYDPEVTITSPEAFAMLRGEVEVRGAAHPEGFQYFRLQYGQGLNPTRWVQIGEDAARPVQAGMLGRWDTSGLSGLYTLQLLVVREEGRVATAAVPVTVDNLPPAIRLVSPEEGQVFQWPADEEVILQAEVSDDIQLARVEFYIDGRGVATATAPPYSTRWPVGESGEHVIFVRAYDAAGNRAESDRVTITVRR